jgi:hypothetical protein
MIQEGTYAFMAGGLQDDAEAQKAIRASNDVAAKTEELAPGTGATASDTYMDYSVSPPTLKKRGQEE